MAELKALLFDCDGVIAETEANGHRTAFNETFKQESIDAFWDEEEYGELVKIGGGKERMSAYFNKYPEKYSPERFTKEFTAHLHQVKTGLFLDICGNLPARPGIKRLMLEAHDAGIQVFICSTSNEKSVSAIASAVLGDKKDDVISEIYAGDMVKAKKPAPDIYLMVTENYPITASECVVIEDSRIGLLSAKAAGMKCVVTKSRYGFDESFAEADLVLDCISDNITLQTLRDLVK